MLVLTTEEYQALVTVLQRAPITPAEAIGLREILAKITPAESGQTMAEQVDQQQQRKGGE